MKSRTITIIDYGMGNIGSLSNAFNYLGAKVKISTDPHKIEKSNIVILPGVGSFHKAMKIIKKILLIKQLKTLFQKETIFFVYV